MSHDTDLVDLEPIRGAFCSWQAEQEPLAAQLSESVAALAAYQSQLDGWQQQLAREREEVRIAREQLARDRAKADDSHGAELTALQVELKSARDKAETLATALLSRTDELRVLDNRRAELVTELELSRARENELRAALQESRTEREAERSQWHEELRGLRAFLGERAAAAPMISSSLEEAHGERPSVPAMSTEKRELSPGQAHTTEPAVFGSVYQQFDKLRQQRASRPAPRK